MTFAGFGDVIRVEQAEKISLAIDGPFSKELGDRNDNLVLNAAHLLQQVAKENGMNTPGAAIYLNKKLPIASGIGGGSADAAATLLALCELWNINPDSIGIEGIAMHLGADVPMCIISKPLIATGIGEKIRGVALAELNMVLINPGVNISTPEIFQTLIHINSTSLPQIDFQPSSEYLYNWLQNTQNDLQAPAIDIAPQIQTVLDVLEESDECQFARMSGSGATCFGLFSSFRHAEKAANDISQRNPDWWCVASKSIAT